MSDKKEFSKLVRLAKQQGWEVLSSGGHYILRSPEGQRQTLSKSPGAWRGRGLANARADLKRKGLQL